MAIRTAASMLALAAGLACQGAWGAYHSFTDRSLFDAKLAQLGLAPVAHDFDNETAGPIIAGTAYDGITFTDWLMRNALQFRISGEPIPPTLTPPNQIGTDIVGNNYQMANGSWYSFSIPPARAFGLYVQSADEITEPTDFTLTFGGGSASVDPDNPIEVNPGEDPLTYAWFLGIIDDAGVNTTGTLSSDPIDDAVWFWFTADNFVTAPAPAPIPATLALMGLGLIGVRIARSRQAA